MGVIDYIEYLAGKDKLEIEFKIHDYIKWADLKINRDFDEDICRQLHKLMKCYYFHTQITPYYHSPVLNFIFDGVNIVSEIIVDDDVIKVTFTKESLFLRVDDNWLTSMLRGE